MPLADRFQRLVVRLGPEGKAILALHDRLASGALVEETAWLYRAARKRARIVEIGPACAPTAAVLSEATRESGARITAIDAAPASRARLIEIERVEPKPMTPLQALASWDGSAIDLLVIDNPGNYADARLALAEWGRLVTPGGVMALREHHAPDEALRAWRDEVEKHAGAWTATRTAGNLVWATRS